MLSKLYQPNKSTNDWFSKFNKWTKQRTNEHKGFSKTYMLKDFISFKKIKHGRKNEIANSQKSKVLTNKPNPLHFSQWHKVPKRKGFVFQQHTKDRDQKMRQTQSKGSTRKQGRLRETK